MSKNLVLFLILALPTSVMASLSIQLARCTEQKVDASRLACYDALTKSATGQVIASKPSSKWEVTHSKSAIDDTPTVILDLESEELIRGWLNKTFRPYIRVECRERKTRVLIVTGMSANVEGSPNMATVTVRFDSLPAFRVATTESTNNEALFFPSPIPLVKQMLKADRMLVQFIPFNSSSQTVTFTLAGLNDEITPLQKACRW